LAFEKVILSKFAEKQIEKIPPHIYKALMYWARSVEREGLRNVRKISGYHDEPLRGSREGQRSIRLNRSYRAIYIEFTDEIEILIIEVNKHEY
jgi:toxin HigB-1